MKSKEKFYVLNNQEDEDGYPLYPGDQIMNENLRKKQDNNSHNNLRHTESSSAKPRFRNEVPRPVK